MDVVFDMWLTSLRSPADHPSMPLQRHSLHSRCLWRGHPTCFKSWNKHLSGQGDWYLKMSSYKKQMKNCTPQAHATVSYIHLAGKPTSEPAHKFCGTLEQLGSAMQSSCGLTGHDLRTCILLCKCTLESFCQ